MRVCVPWTEKDREVLLNAYYSAEPTDMAYTFWENITNAYNDVSVNERTSKAVAVYCYRTLKKRARLTGNPRVLRGRGGKYS